MQAASLTSLPIGAADKVFRLATAHGVAREVLLAGIALRDDADDIDVAQLCALYELAASLTRDDAFGLHVGEATAPRMYEELGYIVANSATLGEALENLVSYQPLWSRAAGFTVTLSPRIVRLSYWLRPQIPAQMRRHESEQMLASLAGFIRQIAGSTITRFEVRFEHSAPNDVTEHRRVFGGRIAFGSTSTEILVPHTAMNAPNEQADPILYSLMKGYAETPLAVTVAEPLLDLLRRKMKDRLRTGQPATLDGLARAIGVGSRTLQRGLRRNGSSFRALREEVRLSLAKDLLASGSLSLDRIAHSVGYSQTSAFHRAFHRALGETPGAYRRRLTNMS